MITVIRKKITGIGKGECSSNHRNLIFCHRNQFTKRTAGQSIAEYGIVISLVAAALLAMQVYMKRGIQAVIKQSTDQFSTQDYLETDINKVAPTATTMDTTSESAYGFEQEGVDGGVRSTYTSNETSSSTGVSTVTKTDEL